MPPLKILISGGGVAGTSLAFWLTKLNQDVTVVEWYPCLRTTGLQIDLRGQGIDVLKRMGLEKAFRDNAAPEEGIQFVDSKGRNRAYFGANKSGKGPQGFTSDYEIMRGDLCRIIYDATNGRAKYVYGTSIANFKELGDGVEVTFKNGNTERYDLLVGADGNASSTRRKMLGPDAPDPFISIGENNAYFTVKRPREKGEKYVGTMYLGTNKRGILVRRHNPDEIQLYFLLNRDDDRIKRVRRGDVEAEKAAFTEIYRGAGWKTEECLEALRDSKDFYCERLGIVKMDSWHQGHVALLGDAAFGPGGSGMGTTCAMLGAYVLAGEIGRHCGHTDEKGRYVADNKDGIAAALKAYEEKFRPFMDQVQKGLDSNAASWIMPSSAFGIAVLHYILEFLVFILIEPVMKWFLKEAMLNWQLPDYEELRRGQEEEAAASQS